MGKVELALPLLAARNDVKKTLNWKDNPSVQPLLDVIASIIANEYIEIAKKNKDVFEIASSGPSAPPRNDERGAPVRNDKEVKNESSDIR